MVSTLNLEEKYNRVRKNFCFYLDIQDHELARSISRRLQDMTLQQEVFLTSRVTHVVSDGGAPALRCSAPRTRADAMLERVRADQTPRPNVVYLTVQKAICLLDKLYDTFFTAPRKPAVRFFTKEYIKIEFLDKICRPVFKEFDEWPEISVDPDPPREKKNTPADNKTAHDINENHRTAGQKMTRKSRPRIKEKEEKEPKGGYCEMCNTDYMDIALHRRSPHHLTFVREHTNFLALDSLINSGADVTTFLDKATPINGERRSLRKMCNGDAESKSRRSKRSQSPDSTVNGDDSPKHNGALEEDKKHRTRCSKKLTDEERQYYKVVGVSTKLRSSGGFVAKPKESPPACNGSKPIVVKFKKVRRSELSVLSDEAEQFMFPKRASSTSSTSSEEEEKPEELSPRRKTITPQPPPLSVERRRLARPVALKEESSEEDIWPEDNRRRKRRGGPAVKRGRRVPLKPRETPAPAEPEPEKPAPPEKPEPPPAGDISPLREEPLEKCMKWEDGKLKYTPAVEQLEFAFELVPKSEPWFSTFKRQDQDKVVARNISQYFALYSAKSPKLPYEMGLLPPLKPNCCPLSDLIKRDDKAGPSRSYGTRGMKKQRIRKRTAAAALIALEAHPRKSPREHASTLAILGSAGLLHKRRHHDDTKSTASEDTISDTHSTLKADPVVSQALENSERLKQFMSEVFEDASDYEVSEDAMDGEAAVVTSTNLDMTSLVSECEDCDIIRKEMKESIESRKGRRGKFKKKNKTGWPNKKKGKKGSRTSSLESQKPESLDRSSAEPPDDETTQDTISEEDANISEPELEKTDDKLVKTEAELEKTVTEVKCDEVNSEEVKSDGDEKEKTLVEEKDDQSEEMEVVETPKNKRKRNSRSSTSDNEEKEDRRRKRRALAGLLLQPVVRVARVDPNAARRLRSAAKPRGRGTRLR